MSTYVPIRRISLDLIGQPSSLLYSGEKTDSVWSEKFAYFKFIARMDADWPVIQP